MLDRKSKIGDLIHIPANVSLFKEEEVTILSKWKHNMITKILKTEKPEIAILLDKQFERGCGKSLIFLNGEYWHCNNTDMFVYDGS